MAKVTKNVNVDIVDSPVAEIEKATVKSLACNVVYWNKHSNIIAFDYSGTTVQMKSNIEFCGTPAVVNVLLENGNYKITEI